MITNTISWPELVWTLAAGVGLAFNTVITFRAAIDLLTLRLKRINSIREYAAITTLLAYGSWTFVQFVFVIIGVQAMIKPNPVAASKQTFALVCFLTCSILLAALAVVIEKRRTILVKKLREIES